MISHNLIVILSGFSKSEFLKFDDFVNSSYFNKEQQVKLLWSNLKGFSPDYSNIKKEDIFRKMYPGENCVESRIRNLCSDLKMLAEKFLMVEALMNDKSGSEIYLLESFIANRHYDLFNSRYEKAYLRNTDITLQDEWRIENSLKLNNLKYAYLNAGNGEAEENEEVFKKINQESVKFFLSVYFKNCHRILNKRRAFFKYGYMPKYFKEACEILESNIEELKDETYLLLQYYAVMLYMYYDVKNFHVLYDFIFEINFDKLGKGDVTDIIIALVNYCRTESLSGDKQYEYKALELYKLMSNNNIWDSENLLRPSVYRATVSVACNCCDFEWAEYFINKFKNFQPKEHIESNSNLCYGRLYFEKKEFSKALDALAKAEALDSTYKYEADTLTIRIFYETSETEAYISKVNSFKKWVTNNKTVISERYRNIFKKMSGYFSLLIKLKLEPDEFAAQKMKSEIEENKTLVNRGWFLEKINELLM